MNIKKLGYGLLYVIPALICIGFGYVYIVNVIEYFDNSYVVMGIVQLLIALVFIFLSFIYTRCAIKQDNINKYTSFSVLSWYIGIVLYILLLNINPFSEGNELVSFLMIGFISIFGALLFAIIAVVAGVNKGEIKLKY